MPLQHPREGRWNCQNPCGGFQQCLPGVETEIGLGLVESWPPLGHCRDFSSLSAGGGLRGRGHPAGRR